MAIAGILSITALMGSATAWGHAFITSPPPRLKDCQGDCKTDPCGKQAKGSPKVAIDKKGQLKVDYSETIDHTGCFIIEISKTGDDKNFQVLKTISDPANAGVSAANPKTRTETIQLDGGIECQNCTLRLRQIMSGTTTGCGPNTQASTYFSCSDIMIGADASLPDAGMQEEEDSGTTTPDAGSGSNNKDAGTSDGDDDDDDDGSGSPKKDTGGCSTVPGDLPYGGAIGVGLMAAFALIARSRKRRS